MQLKDGVDDVRTSDFLTTTNRAASASNISINRVMDKHRDGVFPLVNPTKNGPVLSTSAITHFDYLGPCISSETNVLPTV